MPVRSRDPSSTSRLPHEQRAGLKRRRKMRSIDRHARRHPVCFVLPIAFVVAVFLRGLLLHGLVRVWARIRTGAVAGAVLTTPLFASLA